MKRLAVALIGALFAVSPFAIAHANFVTFESGHTRPLALSSSGDYLFAVNTPDNRLEVFRVTAGGLEFVSDVRVGLEPVAVAVRGSEVYVVNHLSDSVSCVDATDPASPVVKETLLVGDEPRDVVVGGPNGDRIFVTTAHRGQNNPSDPQLQQEGVDRADVWVYDAADLASPLTILTLFCDTPRALAVTPDGNTVYAAAFHSGNQTTTLSQLAVSDSGATNSLIDDDFDAPGIPEPTANKQGIEGPGVGLIVKRDEKGAWRDEEGTDWTPRLRFDLPDYDVFSIDASQTPPIVSDRVSGVGTILFNLAVHPTNGKVYCSNLESRNHVRFEPEVNGHIAESRVSIIDGDDVSSVHINPHIDYSTPSGSADEIAQSLAFPTDMVFTADGSKLFVAAFGSKKVGVLDADGQVLQQIDVGGGPSGVALDSEESRLFVMNRFDHSISIVDVESGAQTGVVPLRYNPEPGEVLVEIQAKIGINLVDHAILPDSLRVCRLLPASDSPLVVYPCPGQRWEDSLFSVHALVREHLPATGALLFRGFDLLGEGPFQRFAESFGDPLLSYEFGSTPRSQ
ncbi:MAG: hypothetical protein AAF517_25155, partial [Planctomycetota bacterium]